MDELSKIIRVLKKLDPKAPHDTVLVLDATTGQNAHSQVEIFKQMVDLYRPDRHQARRHRQGRGGRGAGPARSACRSTRRRRRDDRRPAPVRGRGLRAGAARPRGGARAPEPSSLAGRRRCRATWSRRSWVRVVLVVAIGFVAWAYGRSNARRSRRLRAARQVRPGRRARRRRRRADLGHQGRPGAGPVARPGDLPGRGDASACATAIELPADSSAAIVSASLLGGKYLSLVPGGDDEMLKDGERDHADPVLGQPRGPDRPVHLQQRQRRRRRRRGRRCSDRAAAPTCRRRSGGPAAVRLPPLPAVALAAPVAAAPARAEGPSLPHAVVGCRASTRSPRA